MRSGGHVILDFNRRQTYVFLIFKRGKLQILTKYTIKIKRNKNSGRAVAYFYKKGVAALPIQYV